MILKHMYPKYIFNLDEVHKWRDIDISLNKLYNHVLRQQDIASLCDLRDHKKHVTLWFGKAAMITG